MHQYIYVWSTLIGGRAYYTASFGAIFKNNIMLLRQKLLLNNYGIHWHVSQTITSLPHQLLFRYELNSINSFVKFVFWALFFEEETFSRFYIDNIQF